MNGLPRRLSAPDPGWVIDADVVVVGSGIAGLTVALRAADLGRVLVVTKTVLSAGSTQWAQGGIAAALGPGDSPAEHERDTVLAGDGLCDPAAVRLLVTEGPAAVRRLIAGGAVFDTGADGRLALTREGGHRRDRVAHAGGDATGAEIQRALIEAVRAERRIEVIEHALGLDLIPAADGGVAGLTLHVMGEGQRDGVGAVHAPVVVLATGGLGQIFEATTNPSVATGDGVAMALRAGAVVRDLEFVQFHPTVLWLGPDSLGQQPLISEAVRGEGAVLRDRDGVAFMAAEHELADLAPRSVVAQAILRRMQAHGQAHVWLDGRELGAQRWAARFPTILASCRRYGIDPVTEMIPVVPACHYVSGGIRTDLAGRSSLPRLYACGEVAWSGVHGANRLASNSLLEGLVFAERIAEDLAAVLPTAPDQQPPRPNADRGPTGAAAGAIRPHLQRLMSEGAGVLRTATGLRETAHALEQISRSSRGEPCVESWEATNLLTVASTLVAAAAARTETRGSHWRSDHPDRDDLSWLVHLDYRLTEKGLVMERVTDEGLLPSAALRSELAEAGLDHAELAETIARALVEDLKPGQVDVTSVATVPSHQVSVGDVVARADGVVAGLAVARAVFEQVGRASGVEVNVARLIKDGERVRRGDVVMTVSGPTRELLVAERTALNFLCHLSGVATATRAWVDAIGDRRAAVRDTRKTTPGLRTLEKYAVRAGGGVNHRMALWDAALIKDNHVVAAGGVRAAFEAVREKFPGLEVEVEVDSLDQLRAVLEAGADRVLLDNFTPDQMRAAVELTAGRARLEASGGLALSSARAVADTGVDYISVGALTHSSPILDLALDLRMIGEGGP